MTDAGPPPAEQGWSGGECPTSLFARRSFLRGAAAVGLAGAAADSLLGSETAYADTAPDHGAVPLFGEHQSGITTVPTTPQPQGMFASFDVTAKDRREVTDLFRTRTSRARFLTKGGPAPKPGPRSPSSGLLGSTVGTEAV